MVTTQEKVRIYDAIMADDGEGLFYGWDGTFSDLHRFVDANGYLEGVARSHADDPIGACNEVIAYLDSAFKEALL